MRANRSGVSTSGSFGFRIGCLTAHPPLYATIDGSTCSMAYSSPTRAHNLSRVGSGMKLFPARELYTVNLLTFRTEANCLRSPTGSTARSTSSLAIPVSNRTQNSLGNSQIWIALGVSELSKKKKREEEESFEPFLRILESTDGALVQLAVERIRLYGGHVSPTDDTNHRGPTSTFPDRRCPELQQQCAQALSQSAWARSFLVRQVSVNESRVDWPKCANRSSGDMSSRDRYTPSSHLAIDGRNKRLCPLPLGKGNIHGLGAAQKRAAPLPALWLSFGYVANIPIVFTVYY